MSGSTLQKQLIKQVGLILLVASCAFGQVDILNNSRNSLIDLGRNLSWGTSGRGGINNYFIFTPVNPSESFCLIIANKNPTNSHTFTLQIGSTTDQTVTSFAADNSRWATATVANSGTGAPISVNAYAINATASSYYGFFRIVGASRVVVAITASSALGGNPDTADVMVGQATATNAGATSCQPSPANTPDQVVSGIVNGASGPTLGVFDLPYDCPLANAFNLAAGTDVQLVAGVAGKIVHICHLSFSSNTGADFLIQTGTGPTCGVSTNPITGTYKNVTQFIEDYPPYTGPVIASLGVGVCLHFGATVTTGGLFTYALF